LNEKFEYQGYWWLPSADEEKVPGILKFDPEDGASLDLLGSLKGLKGVIDPLEPEIILGLSADGKLITLQDCGKTSGNLVFGSGFSTSTFVVNTIFVGEHFDQAEDLGFERLVVEYLHLEAWAHESGFDISFNEEIEEPKRRWREIRHDLPESFTAAVGGTYEVTLDFGSNFRASQRPFTEVNITQPAELAIRFPEKQPFDRLSDIVYRLQHLLSLGTRRSSYPVAVRGYTGIPGEAMPVEVHYRPLGSTGVPQKRPELHEMLFSLRNLPGGFGPAVARWLDRAEVLDPVYRLYFGTVYNPQMFLEQRFLNLVQALEAYHRRTMGTADLPEEVHEKRKEEILEAVPNKHKDWLEGKLEYSNEPSLGRRLKEIIRRYPEATYPVAGDNSKDRERFVYKVTATRNYRTHFDETLEGQAAQGEELYRISQKLKQLLEVCLMAEIGFGGDEIKKAVMRLR